MFMDAGSIKLVLDIPNTVSVDRSNWYVLALALITAIVGVIVYFVQEKSRKATFFRSCAKSLYSGNDVEQSTAAILLRDFIKKRRYAKNTKNIMVALLRTPIPISLQKTVADVFSYAKNLKGQDLQYINMLDALIKPQSRIDFELTGSKRYKRKRLSMRQADLYHAIIQECNINNIDATKAVFFCANVKGTAFKNCVLREANFKCAYVGGATFDMDCKLKGACFKDAVGLENALVQISEDTSYPLIYFLDAKGVFTEYKEEERYLPTNKDYKIFVSKLGAMDTEQRAHYQGILSMINSFENTTLEIIERKQYPLVSQLPDVLSHLDRCDGCVIFAFEYMSVQKGCFHKNIVDSSSDDCKEVTDGKLASPWLHIEAALANSKSMPCLIIYDKDLLRDGMFDEKIVKPDKNLLALEYSDSIKSDNDIIIRWMSRVREYHSKAKR